MMRAGVGFPVVVTVIVIPCNPEYRITIPHAAVLIHGVVHGPYCNDWAGFCDAFFVEARYMEVETPVPTGFVPIRVGLLL